MTETRLTVLDQLDQLEDVVLDGSRIPFSGGRLVNEQEAIEVIDALRGALPLQFTQAVSSARPASRPTKSSARPACSGSN
jgi:hypothetical protein